MSDTWLVFVPEDPRALPAPDAIARALDLLKQLAPDADEVAATVTDDVRFHDCGENWSGVTCPRCAADIEDWWFEAMDAAFRSAFADLRATTPCCSLATTLNDVTFGWPAGFGRVALAARNPGIFDTTPDQDAALDAAAGLKLRKIWRRI